jgi:outer membrane protein
MKSFKFIILLWLAFGFVTAQSQEILSLEDAVTIALQNNFNVRVATNQGVIDKSNNTLGNAGFMPDVVVNFGNANNINNTKQKPFVGVERELKNANTTNINANVQLAWTVFDGLRMFVNRERLSEIESVGQLNIQMQMESTIYQVMSSYYNIAQHKRRITTIEKAIEISKERRELAKLKLNVGSGSSIPVLQAEVDINTDSAALIRQQLVLKISKTLLNEILSRSPEVDFEITNTIETPFEPDYQNLVSQATARNRMLQMADKNIRLSEINIKLWEANKYPTLDVNLGYNFNRLNAEIGIFEFNQTRGLSYGLTGRWNVFSGYNNKREIQVAKLALETNKLNKDQTGLAISTDIFTFYTNYLTSAELSKLEERNIMIARQNLDITTEKMRVGTTDALELRQAQLNLVDTEFRKIAADFEVQLAKLEMKRLTGELLK